MTCQLEAICYVSSSCETLVTSQTKGSIEIGSFPRSLQSKDFRSTDFMGKSLHISDKKGLTNWSAKSSAHHVIHAQASVCVGYALRWWEKALKPNMIEIYSAQELVDSLLNAGNRLVIVDFYSPGCGGCKALHPKICQLAESSPDVLFLKVNYEELKTMCHSLHIHVLPFFRFYRGEAGRLCSFSCTNATIKKFKKALAKYGTDLRSVGPAKGLDESELLCLASNGQVSKYRMDDLVADKAMNLESKNENAILA